MLSNKAESLGISTLKKIYNNKRKLPQLLENQKKKLKLEPMVPITWGRLRSSMGRKARTKTLKILMDSGASQTILVSSMAEGLRTKKAPTVNWKTAAGIFQTNRTAKIYFTLPEFYEGKLIEWKVHLFPATNNNYEMIIGRDLLTELGIEFSFSKQIMTWNDKVVPMKFSNCTETDSFHVQDTPSMEDALTRMKRILDAKYEAANLPKVVDECSHLTKSQKQQLLKLLQKFESLFDGPLGTWQGEEIHIDLREGAQPYHAKPFPIPKAYEQQLKAEVQRLCNIGVLKRVNHSEWGAPTFVIPKKDGTIRFISDFRELNKRIKRQPYPIPKIQDLMLKLEGFNYGTSLDLNMGYYHILLSPQARKLCTIVLPFGKYEYQKLPMGLANSPDIFQEKMSNLMQDLEYVRAYIDDLLIITPGTWEEHLTHLEQVFVRLQQAGLKINAGKSKFAAFELEYLGYWITRRGIQPTTKKIQAIQQLAMPKNKKELRRFIGLVNYYRDMWIRRSHILTPLTKLTSKTIKWEWGPEQTKAFEDIKKIVSKETLLTYPNFKIPFEIHTDASDRQIGSVISQNNLPIAFYLRKLTYAQTKYTVTERELLAIVETLKEFRNILLGHIIKVYTDHKNLTYKTFNTDRVIRWRLILEEYGPEFIYVKGEHNIVADALSRLTLLDSSSTSVPNATAEYFGTDKLPDDLYPLRFKTIAHYQQQDPILLATAKRHPDYSIKIFRGGGKKRLLICKNNKIVLPKILIERVVEWYHTTLCHPGETRTEQTIRQHFTGHKLRETVHTVCSTCPTCQITKKSQVNYGHLPEKRAEAIPWERLCVDLIGPYTIRNRKESPNLKLWCLTMIDPATGWFEVKDIKKKTAINIANILEHVWLTRYPWPQMLQYDKGSEFMAEFAEMIENDYGIKRKGSTTRNPQANAIIERIHQTLGNIIRTFELHKSNMTPKESWDGILSAAMFALRATYHTTLQATPMQLVFGRDAILNTQFEADWKLIKLRKQKLIHYNNQKENKNRIQHQYKVGDKVLHNVTKGLVKPKYGQNPYEGPYTVRKVNDNGTLTVQMGPVLETINIRLLKPFREKNST